jgi:hypothetical protein
MKVARVQESNLNLNFDLPVVRAETWDPQLYL